LTDERREAEDEQKGRVRPEHWPASIVLPVPGWAILRSPLDRYASRMIRMMMISSVPSPMYISEPPFPAQ
jgi:hypothetical protein